MHAYILKIGSDCNIIVSDYDYLCEISVSHHLQTRMWTKLEIYIIHTLIAEIL